MQEALLRAFRSRSVWRRGGSVMTWLYGITLNAVREIRRNRHRGFADGFDLDDLRAGGPAGETPVDEQALGDLAKAIDQLPPRQREALVCRHLRRLSVRETAEVMGCAEGTVKAAVAAALENLRKCPSLRYLKQE